MKVTGSEMREVADALDAHDLPKGNVEVHWHGCNEDALRKIMLAFPAAKWQALSASGGTDWIEASVHGIRLVAFGGTPHPPTNRLAGLVEAVTA